MTSDLCVHARTDRYSTSRLSNKEKILFSSRDLPLVIAYNFETKTHIFYTVEIDLESVVTTQETLNFENLIQNIDPVQSSFIDNALKSHSNINLREIFRDNATDHPTSQIKITSSVFNPSQGAHRQQVFVYMLTGKGKDSQMRVFSLSFLLHEKSQKLFFSESVKRLRVFEGVSMIKRMSFLSQAHETSFLKSKDFFASSKRRINHAADNEKAQAMADPSKLEKRFLNYLKQKMTVSLFESTIAKDAVVAFKPSFGMMIIVEDFALAEITLAELNPSNPQRLLEPHFMKITGQLNRLRDSAARGVEKIGIEEPQLEVPANQRRVFVYHSQHSQGNIQQAHILEFGDRYIERLRSGLC